jgi:hypothetical protein
MLSIPLVVVVVVVIAVVPDFDNDNERPERQPPTSLAQGTAS